MSDGPNTVPAITPPPVETGRRARDPRRFTPARIAGIYLVFGLVWIWLSDGLLLRTNVWGEGAFWTAAGKGTLFVFLSTALVYWLVWGQLAAISRMTFLVRAVTDGATDAMFVKDRDGKYLLFNEAAARFVGKPVHAVLGRDDGELFDATSVRVVMDRDRRVMATGRAETQEEELTAAGLTRTYLATKAPYRDESGRVIGLIGISHDITERKRSEQALRASEQRFRELADAIPQIVWTAGPDGGLTHLNAKATEYSGLGTDLLAGWSWERVIHPDDLSHTVTQWSEVLNTGVPRDIEFRIRRADGAYHWHITRQVPTRDADGAIVGWYGTCTDVEELKRAEGALRESEERLKLALSAAHMGAWDWDLRTDRVYRSPECHAILGAESIGGDAESFARVLHSDDAAAVRAEFGRAVADRSGFAHEFRIVQPNGEVRWVLDTGRTHCDDTGVPIRMIGVLQDVTDRKLAGDALRISEQRYRTLVDHATDEIVLLAADTTFLDVNHRTCEMLGYSRDELIGLSPLHIDPNVTPERLAAMTAALDGGELISMDTVQRRKDGTTFPVEVRVKPFWADGKRYGLAIVRDITERNRSEEALRESEGRLRMALQGAKGGVWDWDLISGRAWWSKEMYDLWGVPYDETMRLANSVASIHEQDRDRVRRMTEEAISQRSDYQCEFRITHPVCGERWMASHGRIQCDESGHPYRMIGISLDVTERKWAEEALRAERDRFTKIAETVPGVIHSFRIRSDGSASFPYASPGITTLYGLTPEALALDGSAVLAMIHPDDTERVARSIAESARTMTPWRDSYRIHHPDGREVWIEGHSAPAREPDGGTVWHGFLADVTERKRGEEVLRFQHALLRSQTEASPDGILVVGSGNRVLSYNHRFVDVWGIPEDLVAAGDDTPILALAHTLAADPTEFTARVAAIYSDPDASSHDEVALADGRTLDRYSGPIRGTDGERLGRVWFFRDVSERKRIEETIRENESRFRGAFEYTNVAMVLTDLNNRFLRVNEAFARLFGYSQAEMLTQSMADITHPAHLAESYALREELLNRKTNHFAMEKRYVHKDGHELWGLTNVALVRDSEGRPHYYVGQVQDITDHKRAEEVIRESEERYRRLVNVLPAAVFIHSDGEIVFCNAAYVQLLGANTEEELIGKNPFDLIHPDFHAVARARITNMDASGRSMSGIDIRVVRLDGRSVPVYSVSTPITYRGRPAYLIALSDLTERERSMEVLRSVLGSVTDAILTIDPRGIVRLANPAIVTLFGFTPDEVVGQNVRMLMPEPYRGAHDGYLANYLRTGEAKVIGTGREVVGRRKNGTTFPAELTVTEVLLDGERHFTGVLRDITARKLLEDQFRQAQKMEAVGRLAGGVAHDFNNLLTVVNGYGDLLLMDLSVGDPRREPVAAIRDAGERASRLTQQLLAFSRKAIVAPKVLDLNEIVTDSAKLLGRLIGEDVRLTVIPHSSLPRIKADAGQLEQVVMNLAVNARDAMPTGGRLTLETRPVTFGEEDRSRYPGLTPGRYVELTVTDTGHGMPEAVRAQIFEPFFTTKGVGKGTGLGLAVVHGVVTQCDGHIGVESQTGVGTTFRLLFPAVAESIAEATSGAPKVASRGTETILLVEDEDAVRTIARIALEMQGYQILVAECGAEAVQIADAFPQDIHLLVTDVIMPEMGGRQLVEAVRERRPEMRVLYMSGYTDDAVLLHGVVEATDAFLQKPFTPLGLARKVRAVLDRSHGGG